MKFLINATHDIRSPLTLIMSPLNNLKRQLTQSNVDVSSDLDTIERNAHRILNLVNQILDVRKIDKQQMHLHCQKTDLVSFARGICKMFEYNAQEHHIDFSLDCGSLDKLDVWIDRSQFDKVIVNLLSNAFKYTADERHHVRLTLRTDDRQARSSHRQRRQTRRGQLEAHLRSFLSGRQRPAPEHQGYGHRSEPL